MKFAVSRNDILEPLQRVANVVERRQTLPILSNLLLVVSDDLLTVTGTDQEVELTSKVSLSAVEAAGEITVPARKLTDICKSLPDQAQISFELQENRLQVRSGQFKSHLATLPVIDFPNVETEAPSASITLPAADLSKLVEKTSFAMAQQDVRYFFNGLLIETSSDGLRAVATNGQRLATSVLPQIDGLSDAQFIIPRKGVQELSRLIGTDDKAEVELSFSANHMRATSGKTIIISKLIDATYPDYTRAIPGSGDKVVVGERLALREALTRTAILSNEMYKNVRLILAEGRVEMHANNPLQEEAEETVNVDYTGGALEIGFNVNYLIEALSVMGGSDVNLAFTDSNSACLLTDPDDIDSCYVISPMML